jgi:chromosome segregation ATPase
MNQYFLLLGPALGFILGAFFTWFLVYAKIKQVERAAEDEKKMFEERIEQSKSAELELSGIKSRLEETKSQIERLQAQLEEKSVRLEQEADQRAALEERVTKIPVLEKTIEELKIFEQEVAAYKEKNQSLELHASEKRKMLEKAELDLDEGRKELKNAVKRIEDMQERLKELAIVRERARKLEEENANLLKENEQLRNIEAQLRQIDDIKEMYGHMVEENQSFRNENLARHFIEIKDGLQQSIKAYNRMLKLVDNPMLDDSKTIELEAPKSELSEEEILDETETDTSEIEKLDGVN